MISAASRVYGSDIFRLRASVFMAALLGVLRWARDTKATKLDTEESRTALPFSAIVAIVAIVQRRLLPTPRGSDVAWVDLSDMPDEVVAPLRAYLCEIPDFDRAHAAQDQPSSVAHEHHSMVLFSLHRGLETYLA